MLNVKEGLTKGYGLYSIDKGYKALVEKAILYYITEVEEMVSLEGKTLEELEIREEVKEVPKNLENLFNMELTELVRVRLVRDIVEVEEYDNGNPNDYFEINKYDYYLEVLTNSDGFVFKI